MTSERDDLLDRLDAVADAVDADETETWDRHKVVYEHPDGRYIDDDGNPAPTDDDGNLDYPDGCTVIIYDGAYTDPDAVDGDGWGAML